MFAQSEGSPDVRVLAIGDIHGCFTALTTLERYTPISKDDKVVTVGDYVDRGPKSCEVLDWLIARKKDGNLSALLGNHELMMMAARKSARHYDEWIACGGDAALRSYSPFGDVGKLADVPDSHWDFMERGCRSYWQTSTHFFVHANALPNIPLNEQPDYMLYWEQFRDPQPHDSGKIMVCGHTPQRTGVPLSVGHAVCIDTRVHAGGWLTCLDPSTGQYWQASETGRTRTGFVDSSP